MKGLIKIKKEKIVRAMIESTLNLVLKHAKSDPKRSIRNTLELAFNNSHGRFQRSLFEGAQRMLKNEDSAYYTLAERAISEIDHDIIKKFGINLGYNGCTCGAERIRRNEEKLGFNIPWAFYISAQRDDKEVADMVWEIVSQGMKLGVYVYFIFGDASMSENFREIYHKFDECAFIALCGAECINEALMADFDGINNVMISVNSDDEQRISVSCDTMRAIKRLYCIHEFYNNESAADLFTEDKLKLYDGMETPFVCMIPSNTCSAEVCNMVRQQVFDIRFGQQYPYFVMDFAADMTQIDHVISDDTCWVLFDSDGGVVSSTGTYSGEDYSILSHSLSEILRKVTPPKQNHS